MSKFITGVSTVFIFVLLVLPGIFLKKKNYIKDSTIDDLSFLLLNLIWPAMILDAMLSANITAELLQKIIYTAIVCVGGYIISIVIAMVYTKIIHMSINKCAVIKFAIVMNNTGFIGLPLIKFIYGNEALILASIIEIVADIFIFSIGILMMDSGKIGISWSSLNSPSFICIIAGLFLFVFQAHLPDILEESIHILGNATTVLAMIIIGAQIAESNMREILKNRELYVISFLRLILIPAILYIVLYLFFKNNAIESKVLVMMFSMPSASCTAIFARKYKKDYGYATAIVMLTTILSVVTLSLWMTLV